MTIVSVILDSGCRNDVKPSGSLAPLCASVVVAVCTDIAVGADDPSGSSSTKMLKACVDGAAGANIDFAGFVCSFSLKSVVA